MDSTHAGANGHEGDIFILMGPLHGEHVQSCLGDFE